MLLIKLNTKLYRRYNSAHMINKILSTDANTKQLVQVQRDTLTKLSNKKTPLDTYERNYVCRVFQEVFEVQINTRVKRPNVEVTIHSFEELSLFKLTN